jgi:hypothetical protein
VPVYAVEHSFTLYGASCIYGFKCPFKCLTSLDPESSPVRAIQFGRGSLERRTLLHFSTSNKFFVSLHWLWHMLLRRYTCNNLYIWSSFSEVSIYLLLLLEIVFLDIFVLKSPFTEFLIVNLYAIYICEYCQCSIFKCQFVWCSAVVLKW